MSSSQAYAAQGWGYFTHGLVWILSGWNARTKYPSKDDFARSNLKCVGLTKLVWSFICTSVLLVFDEGNPRLYYLGNMDCFSMYLMFGFSGITSILVGNLKHFPQICENVVFAVTLIVEVLIFMIHILRFSETDLHLHMWLLLIIGAGVDCELIECILKPNPTTAMCRGVFSLLHGSLLVGISLLKYNQENGFNFNEVTDRSFIFQRFWGHFALSICLTIIIKCATMKQLPNIKGIFKQGNNMDLL